jgi:hypothetical protein
MFIEPISLGDAPIGARVRWQQDGYDPIEVEVLEHIAVGEETWESMDGVTTHYPAREHQTLVQLPESQFGPVKDARYGETDWDLWNSDAQVTLLGDRTQ